MNNINDYQPYIEAVAEHNNCIIKINETLIELERLKNLKGHEEDGVTFLGGIAEVLEALDKPSTGTQIAQLDQRLSALKKLTHKLDRRINEARRSYSALLVEGLQEEYSRLEVKAINSLLDLQDSLISIFQLQDRLQVQAGCSPNFKVIAPVLKSLDILPDRYSGRDIELIHDIKNHGLKIPENIQMIMTH